jgi:hypothetical protein
MRLNASKSIANDPSSSNKAKVPARVSKRHVRVRGSQSGAYPLEQVNEEAPSRLVELDFVVFVPLLLKSRLLPLRRTAC